MCSVNTFRLVDKRHVDNVVKGIVSILAATSLSAVEHTLTGKQNNWIGDNTNKTSASDKSVHRVLQLRQRLHRQPSSLGTHASNQCLPVQHLE